MLNLVQWLSTAVDLFRFEEITAPLSLQALNRKTSRFMCSVALTLFGMKLAVGRLLGDNSCGVGLTDVSWNVFSKNSRTGFFSYLSLSRKKQDWSHVVRRNCEVTITFPDGCYCFVELIVFGSFALGLRRSLSAQGSAISPSGLAR